MVSVAQELGTIHVLTVPICGSNVRKQIKSPSRYVMLWGAPELAVPLRFGEENYDAS